MASKSPTSRGNTPAKETTAKKATARKATTRKATSASSTKKLRTASSRSAPQGVTVEKRHQMIAETAFFISQQHGFQGDTAMDDWLRAEAEVDARLLADC